MQIPATDGPKGLIFMIRRGTPVEAALDQPCYWLGGRQAPNHTRILEGPGVTLGIEVCVALSAVTTPEKPIRLPGPAPGPPPSPSTASSVAGYVPHPLPTAGKIPV